jgi:predicted type IV restriction endonuclease
LYQKIARFEGEDVSKEIKRIFKKETNELFIRFLLVNLMESGHAQKLDSFSEISRELTRLTGETDYTLRKLWFFQNPMGETVHNNYTFLTR